MTAASPEHKAGSPWRIWCLATLGWSLIFLLSAYLGRLTVIDGTSVNLLWPAAGVAVVWLALHRLSPVRWLDLLVLGASTVAVDVSTGLSVPLSVGFAAANVVQPMITTALFERWCPQLWINGGAQPFARIGHFWSLAAAAAAGSATGAVLGPAAVWLLADGAWTLPLSAAWFARNTVGIVLTGVVALQLEYLWSASRPVARSLKRPPRGGTWAGARCWLRRQICGHSVEALALCLSSLVIYLAVFPLGHELPLGFLLLGATVWAGLRFSTTFVALHGLVISVTVVVFTLNGEGPWGGIAPPSGRALVTQLFVGMVCVIGLCLSLGRRERAELLARAQAAEGDARSQADVFATIVETMSAGLVVVGASGEPLLGNLAAHHLTSADSPGPFGASPIGRIPAQRPAPGTPPAAIDHLPYREALAGRFVDSADVVIPGRSGSAARTLCVSAAPLPARIGGGAVLVLSDVTQDRREREDLSAFAGIVAHDLLNPLTAISGWADLLDSLLSRAAPDPMMAMAADSVSWIKEAASRASTLVGELLTYTTAGDAPVLARDVDLAAIVAEVVAERSRHVQAPDDGVPPLAPEFRIGPLGHVLGDPVLIRQLINNLIENAMKYVAPGQIPQISIDMNQSPPGWARVSVTDRGIGIPAGQHEAIFENLHRAHGDSGYAGSGIGLSICRRIVERHGGTIAAQDNPGGGTRFVVMLPAVTAERAKSPAARESPLQV